jgi:hypothetical protein
VLVGPEKPHVEAAAKAQEKAQEKAETTSGTQPKPTEPVGRRR